MTSTTGQDNEERNADYAIYVKVLSSTKVHPDNVSQIRINGKNVQPTSAYP